MELRSVNVSARLLENYVPFISGESPLISEGSFTVTPILAILLVVGGALVLVFLIISTYLCVRKQADSVRRYAHWGDLLGIGCLQDLLGIGCPLRA